MPTGTTCQEFRAGTASDLNAILYGVKDGEINNVAPGIGFYFVTVGAGTRTISQTDTGSTPAFGVQSVRIYFAGTCERDHDAESTIVVANGGASFTVSGPRVVRLAFDPNRVNDSAVPNPATVVYAYTTSGVGGSTDTINLTPKP